jgi:hypothetical protein
MFTFAHSGATEEHQKMFTSRGVQTSLEGVPLFEIRVLRLYLGTLLKISYTQYTLLGVI